MTTTPKGGKFETRFMVAGVRYPAKTHDTQAEGEAWELQARAAIKLGKPIPGLGDEKSGGKATEASALGGKDSGTINNVLRTTIRKHWLEEGASKQVLNATTFTNWCGPEMSAKAALAQDNIDKFLDYLRNERRVSNSTINKYASAVRQMVGVSGINEKPDLPFYKNLEGRVRFFSEEEQVIIERQWRLWDRHPEADFFTFLLDTGARPFIDGARMHWNNVFKPQGNSPAACHFIEAKNGNARTVSLTARAWGAVQRQSRDQKGPWSWCNKDDFRRLWDKTRAAFPQFEDAVLYSARHTFGTTLYRRSRDLKLVKDMMGHKNYSTTEIYVHIVGDEHHRVAEFMGRAPAAAPALAVVGLADSGA